ncbi:MAG: hypothetical protein ABR977_14175, partial [Candidatus Dormibacteria bacterium]
MILAAAGLALLLGAAQATAATLTDPTITGITAQCVSEDGYYVAGTLTVVYPDSGGPWYDANVQLEVFAHSTADNGWVSTDATWGQDQYLPTTGSTITQLYYTSQLYNQYTYLPTYDELEVQVTSAIDYIQGTDVTSPEFTCGGPAATPT